MKSADLERIEQKLDAIIRYFNIGHDPQRTKNDLAKLAADKVLEFQKRQERRKHGRQGADTRQKISD
jgi:hypothetical protein